MLLFWPCHRLCAGCDVTRPGVKKKSTATLCLPTRTGVPAPRNTATQRPCDTATQRPSRHSWAFQRCKSWRICGTCAQSLRRLSMSCHCRRCQRKMSFATFFDHPPCFVTKLFPLPFGGRPAAMRPRRGAASAPRRSLTSLRPASLRPGSMLSATLRPRPSRSASARTGDLVRLLARRESAHDAERLSERLLARSFGSCLGSWRERNGGVYPIGFRVQGFKLRV